MYTQSNSCCVVQKSKCFVTRDETEAMDQAREISSIKGRADATLRRLLIGASAGNHVNPIVPVIRRPVGAVFSKHVLHKGCLSQ